MITCPACGTDNREWASHCGECGKPLPDDARPWPRAADAVAPRIERLPDWLRRDVEERAPSPERDSKRRGSALPPIPDGGLTDSMPSWLVSSRREAQNAPAPAPPAGQRGGAADDAPDVTTFLSPEDLPAWLRQVAEMDTLPAAAPGDPHPAPAVAPPGPLIGDEPDEVAASDVHHAPTASIRDAPIDAATLQPPARRSVPPDRHQAPLIPAPLADRRLIAAILAVVAIAAVLIAYAVYLAATG